MNIKKGLKEKNRLIKEINDIFGRMSSYNTVEEGSTRPYDPREMKSKYEQSVQDLISLKTRIHLANSEVYGDIFRLSELKTMVTKFKSLSCQQGKVSRGWGSTQDTVTMTSEIGVVERDEIIKKLELEIESLQDKLDQHNTTTEI